MDGVDDESEACGTVMVGPRFNHGPGLCERALVVGEIVSPVMEEPGCVHHEQLVRGDTGADEHAGDAGAR